MNDYRFRRVQGLREKGGVYMIPARLSFRYEFTPVPSCGSVFVYKHKISYQSESYRCEFTPVTVPGRNFQSSTVTEYVSCKRGTAVRSSMKSLSWESGTGSACAFFDIQSNMASPGRHNHVCRDKVSIHVIPVSNSHRGEFSHVITPF